MELNGIKGLNTVTCLQCWEKCLIHCFTDLQQKYCIAFKYTVYLVIYRKCWILRNIVHSTWPGVWTSIHDWLCRTVFSSFNAALCLFSPRREGSQVLGQWRHSSRERYESAVLWSLCVPPTSRGGWQFFPANETRAFHSKDLCHSLDSNQVSIVSRMNYQLLLHYSSSFVENKSKHTRCFTQPNAAHLINTENVSVCVCVCLCVCVCVSVSVCLCVCVFV